MKHDETNPNLQAWIEPELEARIVAYVLGEASAFEAAELERLMDEKPELMIFKRRIAAVHGLIGLAARPEQAPLRLAPERRAKILETIGAAKPRMTGAAVNSPVMLSLVATKQKRRKQWIWGSSLAASFLFAAILAVSTQRSYKLRPQPDETVLGPIGNPTLAEGSALQALESDRNLPRPAVAAAKEKAIDDVRSRQALPLARVQADAAGTASRGEASRQRPLPARAPAVGGKENKIEVNRIVGAVAPSTWRFTGGAGGGRQAGGPANLDADKKVFAGPTDQPKNEKRDFYNGADVVTLSPFEVSSARDTGYAAGNTLSGTRLNSQVSDLAGSISVVTKQQLTDTASLALNDSFLSGGIVPNGAVNFGAPKDTTFALIAGARYDGAFQTKADAVPPPATQPASPRIEISAATESVSTFSLHVSDVSFRLAQAALARGETPDPERIRPEEFYNAFDYGDPAPTTAEKIGSRIEQSAHPFLQQRNLVRVAMKVPAAGRGAGQPLQLTVLLDTSGSMEREDRVVSVRRAFEVLASLLGPNDRVTLIGFSRLPRLLAEQLPGNQAARLSDLAIRTPYTGGTNLEEVLKLSGELARRHRNPAAQNRIVLITDGAANLGDADPAQLSTMIEQLRQQGIAFDACGVGTDGLNDTILEALTRKGDGRYYLLDKPEDADSGFARQLAGAFRPAAQNVKVQVRFNPARVARYRLIGFEQHRLREEDFRNDQVDAAELAAEEAAVALYQVEVLPQGEGELGEVSVRFRDTATNDMVERSWTMLHEAQPRSFNRATPTLQLAGTAALLAEKLRGGDAANLIELADLAPAVNSLRGQYANEARVQELIGMYDQMRRREGR